MDSRSVAILSLLLLGTLATPHVFVDTRVDCPPEGYVALSPDMNLASLPAGGKYAICQTSEQNAEYNLLASGEELEWTLSHGTFRLRDSTLIVDAAILIEIDWPAQLDFERVVVKEFSPEDRITGGGDFDDGDWAGFKISGLPDDLLHAPPPHYGTFGHCGSLDHVNVDMQSLQRDAFEFNNCTSATLKSISVVGGSDVFFFEDCHGLIAYDLVAAGFTDAGIDLEASSMGLIRPIIYTGQGTFGLQANGGSFVTSCDGLIRIDGVEFDIGEPNDDDPSTIVVAGITNNYFDDDVRFTGPGLLVTLAKCPTKLSSTGYDMRLWENYYTPVAEV